MFLSIESAASKQISLAIEDRFTAPKVTGILLIRHCLPFSSIPFTKSCPYKLEMLINIAYRKNDQQNAPGNMKTKCANF